MPGAQAPAPSKQEVGTGPRARRGSDGHRVEHLWIGAVGHHEGVSSCELPNLGGSGVPPGLLLAGSAVACLTGILAIRTLIILLQRRAFHAFAPYCWAAGVLFLVYLAMR